MFDYFKYFHSLSSVIAIILIKSAFMNAIIKVLYLVIEIQKFVLNRTGLGQTTGIRG